MFWRSSLCCRFSLYQYGDGTSRALTGDAQEMARVYGLSRWRVLYLTASVQLPTPVSSTKISLGMTLERQHHGEFIFEANLSVKMTTACVLDTPNRQPGP